MRSYKRALVVTALHSAGEGIKQCAVQESDVAIILDASGQPRMLGEGAFGQAQAHVPPLVELDK